MKQIKFCAGHRLVDHGGKCENLHGHNYTAQIFVTGTETDSIGRVVDFSVIKRLFKTWIDDHWDHAMVLWDKDTTVIKAIQSVEPNRLHLLPFNPTAENMARFLLEQVSPELLSEIPEYKVQVTKVIIWETETACAEVTLDTSPANEHVTANAWKQDASV